MSISDNKMISMVLTEALKDIQKGNVEVAMKRLNDCISEHPEWGDERFMAELSMFEQLIRDYNENSEWAFLRSLRIVYKYLELHYVTEEILGNINCDNKPLKEKDTIWICWLQGMDNAPDIVKACYKSIQKTDRKVVLLTDENMEQYISFPDYIQEKYKNSIIGPAHYCDLIRTELLNNLGGTWIDATVFITDHNKLGRLLDEEDLFFFHAGNVSEYMMYDNWFMHVKRKSLIIEAVNRMLLEYWKQENSLKHYYFYHLLFTAACKRFPQEEALIPLFSNEPAHVLQHELIHPFSEKRWAQIKDMSFVHKLTFKYPENVDCNDSFLHRVINKLFTL